LGELATLCLEFGVTRKVIKQSFGARYALQALWGEEAHLLDAPQNQRVPILWWCAASAGAGVKHHKARQ
jgi:hypothetical protein